MNSIKSYSAAEGDLAAAVVYYESCSYQVAKKFIQSYRKTLELIQRYPSGGSVVAGDVRRWIVTGFPNAIIYRMSEDTIYVVAIVDLRREPGYWLTRLR